MLNSNKIIYRSHICSITLIPQVDFLCMRSLVADRSIRFLYILVFWGFGLGCLSIIIMDLYLSFFTEFFRISPFCFLRPCFARAAVLWRNISTCISCPTHRLSFLALFQDEYLLMHTLLFQLNSYYLYRVYAGHYLFCIFLPNQNRSYKLYWLSYLCLSENYLVLYLDE